MSNLKRFILVVYSPKGEKVSSTNLLLEKEITEKLKELNRTAPKDHSIVVEHWERTSWTTFT